MQIKKKGQPALSQKGINKSTVSFPLLKQVKDVYQISETTFEERLAVVLHSILCNDCAKNLSRQVNVQLKLEGKKRDF